MGNNIRLEANKDLAPSRPYKNLLGYPEFEPFAAKWGYPSE
jgi:hypothetical protein